MIPKSIEVYSQKCWWTMAGAPVELTASERCRVYVKRLMSLGAYRIVPWRYFLNRRKPFGVFVIVYHQVLPDDQPYPVPYTSVSPQDLEKQILFFKENFQVVTLEHAVEAIVGDRPITSNLLTITFDDGYMDNLIYALLVLQRTNVPATIFVTVGAANGDIILWPDAVRHVIYNAAQDKPIAIDVEPFGEIHLNPGKLAPRIDVIKRLIRFLKTVSEAKKWDFIQNMSKLLEVDLKMTFKGAVLDWDAVRALLQHNVSIGSHTITHPILKQLPQNRIDFELKASKEILERELGTQVKYFAYPNGTKEDVTTEIVKSVKSAGYAAAFTTIRGPNFPGGDLMRVKRTGIYRTDGIQEVALKLCFEKFLTT